MPAKLNGYRILILETREEAQFSRLLQEQGADVMQCPMFTIHAPADPAPVTAWIDRFIQTPCHDLVLMTGEGLRRLSTAARQHGKEAAFVAALTPVRTFARGPKPVRALRDLGLDAQIVTQTPTTAGMIEALAQYDLSGRRLGLQLYPEKDHSALTAAITARGASVDPVLPYVYDRSAGDANIAAAIDAMASGRIDAIALTSSGQLRRLVETARAHGLTDKLHDGMARTRIAAVGPVVADELKAFGFRADILPDNEAFFMRPLIVAMAAALTRSPPRSATTP